MPHERIVVGNGSSEILFALARACDYDRAVIPVPSYIDYAAAVRLAGKRSGAACGWTERDDFVLDWNVLEDATARAGTRAAGPAEQSHAA